MAKFTKPKGAEEFINQVFENQKTNYTEIKFNDTNINTNTSINVKTNNILSHLSNFNQQSVKKKVFNLRLNDYYLEIIRYLSGPEIGISMQMIVYDIVTKELDKKVMQIKALEESKE